MMFTLQGGAEVYLDVDILNKQYQKNSRYGIMDY